MARTLQMVKLRKKLIEVIKKNKDDTIQVDPSDWEYTDWICLIKDRLILNVKEGYILNRERIELLSTTSVPFTGVRKSPPVCGDGGIRHGDLTLNDHLKVSNEVQNALMEVNVDEMEAVLALAPGQQMPSEDFFKEFYARKYKILVDHMLKQSALLKDESNKKCKSAD